MIVRIYELTVKYDRTNRTEFYGLDEYDRTDQINGSNLRNADVFIFNLLMQQS